MNRFRFSFMQVVVGLLCLSTLAFASLYLYELQLNLTLKEEHLAYRSKMQAQVLAPQNETLTLQQLELETATRNYQELLTKVAELSGELRGLRTALIDMRLNQKQTLTKDAAIVESLQTALSQALERNESLTNALSKLSSGRFDNIEQLREAVMQKSQASEAALRAEYKGLVAERDVLKTRLVELELLLAEASYDDALSASEKAKNARASTDTTITGTGEE